MAETGRKPKPSFLKVISGNPGKRPIRREMSSAVLEAMDNGLEAPAGCSTRQLELWNSYVRKAPWLTCLDVPRAFMWVCLHSLFQAAPDEMSAGKISQLRALGSELGLDPASRSRLGAGLDDGKAKDPASQYFTAS